MLLTRTECYLFLAALCDHWRDEVLACLATVAKVRYRALRTNRSFRHERHVALRFGARRLSEVEIIDIDGNHTDHQADDLFYAIQDFLNVYGGCLNQHHILSNDYFSLDHPYYDYRHQFITNAMRQIYRQVCDAREGNKEGGKQGNAEKLQ